jgi:hypothetical protein
MPRSFAIALLAALACAGCDQQDGDRAEQRSPPSAVQGSLELEHSAAGAPDAGTRGGHGADRYVLQATEADALIRGRVRPASARVELADESGRRRARVLAAPDGSFSALLPDLPRKGVTTFRLTARAGRAEPWRTEIVASRAASGASPGTVRVPERDETPPLAALLLRYGDRVVSSVDPVRADRDAPLRLPRPELTMTALTRDADGGTGRVRVSVRYRQSCGDAVSLRTKYFPPSEIAPVRVPPGARAPAERLRRARLSLDHGGSGCSVRGKAWADATNASGLESFSDQIRFEYEGSPRTQAWPRPYAFAAGATRHMLDSDLDAIRSLTAVPRGDRPPTHG